MIRFLATCCAALCIPVAAEDSSCPFNHDAWEEVSSRRRRRILGTADVSSLDVPCAASLLIRLAESPRPPVSPASVLENLVTTRGRLPRELPFELIRFPEFDSRPDLVRLVAEMWEADHGPFRRALDKARGEGAMQTADSLYEFMDRADMLSTFDVLRWAECTSVLEKPIEAARLLCRVSREESRFSPIALRQLREMLEDADSASVVAVLSEYRRCMTASEMVDDVELYRRLADTYYTSGLYRQEALMLAELADRDGGAQTRSLLDVAGRNLRHGLAREALFAGRLAWSRAEDTATRLQCAALLARAWQARGIDDSAAVWARRARFGGLSQPGRAVELFQTSGLLRAADSVLQTMPASMIRDTLMIRQLIFAGELDRAEQAAGNLRRLARWKGRTNERLLWEARTLLFNRKVPRARQCIDSLRFEPSWDKAGEVLGYRYRLGKLSSSFDAAADWGTIERFLYTGRPDKAASTVRLASYPPDIAEPAALRLAGGFVEQGDAEAALEVLRTHAPGGSSPEYRYTRGAALLQQGRRQQARSLLEELILSFPRDVFSSKARVLLMKLDRG